MRLRLWRWRSWCGRTQWQRRQRVMQNVCRLTICAGCGCDANRDRWRRRHGNSRCDRHWQRIWCCQTIGRRGKRLRRNETPVSRAIMFGFKHSAGIMARRQRHRGRRYFFRLSDNYRSRFQCCGTWNVLGLICPCRQRERWDNFLPAFVHHSRRSNRNRNSGRLRHRFVGANWSKDGRLFWQFRGDVRFDLERRRNLCRNSGLSQNRRCWCNGLLDGSRWKHYRSSCRRLCRFHRWCGFHRLHTRFRKHRCGGRWSWSRLGSVISRVNQRSRVNPSVIRRRSYVSRTIKYSRLPNPILSGDELVQSQSVGNIRNVVRRPVGDLIKRADV